MAPTLGLRLFEGHRGRALSLWLLRRVDAGRPNYEAVASKGIRRIVSSLYEDYATPFRFELQGNTSTRVL